MIPKSSKYLDFHEKYRALLIVVGAVSFGALAAGLGYSFIL